MNEWLQPIHLLILIATLTNILLFISNLKIKQINMHKKCKIEILTDKDEINLLKKEADFINNHQTIISIDRETYDFPEYLYVSTIKYSDD